MKVKIVILHKDALIPTYATEGASGFDLVAIEDVKLRPGETGLVKTGLAVSVPRGFELQIRPRSGTSLKTPLRVANSPGTVDSDYRGEICVIVENTAPQSIFSFVNKSILIKKGDRIAQGVICPIEQVLLLPVEALDVTKRNDDGFGSTGQ